MLLSLTRMLQPFLEEASVRYVLRVYGEMAKHG